MKVRSQRNKLTVLVVDDHQVVRVGLTNMLKNVSYVSRVDQAANGKDALRLFKNAIYDLVFMDIKMPVMDGIAATKLIRESHPETRVIALSVYDDDDSVKDMFNSGAIGYLLKNTDQDEIEEAIVAVTKGDVFVSKSISDGMLNKLRGKGSNAPAKLTERENKVLYYLWQGLTSKEIAKHLFLSAKSIELCRSNLLLKTKCKNTVELLKLAVEHKLIVPPDQTKPRA